MGYVASRGGFEAIAAAEALLNAPRSTPELTAAQVLDRLPLAADRVQGEAGLWAPELAARAILQTDGDLFDATQLLRSHRSALPRLAYGEPTGTDQITVLRRISPAYRNPPGGQLLGRTMDYLPRRFKRPARPNAAGQINGTHVSNGTVPQRTIIDRKPPRLYDLLRDKGLVCDRRTAGGQPPFDITTYQALPGSGRSAWLATMSRSDTGALMQVWYRNVLGPDRHLHEVTVGEVRHGYLPVVVRHPHTGARFEVGTIRVTEAEAIEDPDSGPDSPGTHFDVGFGMCIGHNERKAIAMANLDVALTLDCGASDLEQSVLLCTDGMDMSGFLEHLKMPHYVTFRSIVERKLAVRNLQSAH